MEHAEFTERGKRDSVDSVVRLFGRHSRLQGRRNEIENYPSLWNSFNRRKIRKPLSAARIKDVSYEREWFRFNREPAAKYQAAWRSPRCKIISMTSRRR
jgi:hypothetical protein